MMKEKMIIAGIVAVVLSSCASLRDKESSVTYSEVEIVEYPDSRKVEVLFNGESFTSYLYDEALEKPVLYPVRAGDGTLVTRGFPLEPRKNERVDHPHHVGIWLNYGKVNGFDFWNNSSAKPPESKIHLGRIIHREVLRAESLENRGVLEVRSEWVAPDTSGAPVLLEEHTSFLFKESGDLRIIDRITELKAVADEVTFTDNKEGMFAIRTARAFEHQSEKPVRLTDASGNPMEEAILDNEGVSGWYRNSEGEEGPEAWGKQASWVKLGASIKGKPYSIVIFDHPGNLNHPPMWHARGYGLFAANPFGKKDFEKGSEPMNISINPGESLQFRYHVLFYSGTLSKDELDSIYDGYAQEM
jgi:hypothetical protein